MFRVYRWFTWLCMVSMAALLRRPPLYSSRQHFVTQVCRDVMAQMVYRCVAADPHSDEVDPTGLALQIVSAADAVHLGPKHMVRWLWYNWRMGNCDHI